MGPDPNMLYGDFNAHGSLEGVRQELKSVAGSIQDISIVEEGLRSGSDPKDVYAAAEIIRARRDLSVFDSLVKCVDRIAEDPNLEGLRFRTVWTLASAVHRTVLAAVKHTDIPKLSEAQLRQALAAMKKLDANPKVQLDSPLHPERGIKGPAKYAIDWINRGLNKFQEKNGADRE